LDAEGLGIEILFVAVQEAHPSDDVAKSYQDVVKAEIAKEAAIENARKAADTILTNVAGSRSRAVRLGSAIYERDRLAQESDTDAEEFEAATQRVLDLLAGNPARNIPATGGESAQRIAQANARMIADVAQARADRARFEAEVEADRAAPRVYRMRRYLATLERATQFIRKYVIIVDSAKRVIIEYEKEEKSAIELEGLGE
jgi:regulator of protease activity HflC (stomatin/prohibitin superfamily)